MKLANIVPLLILFLQIPWTIHFFVPGKIALPALICAYAFLVTMAIALRNYQWSDFVATKQVRNFLLYSVFSLVYGLLIMEDSSDFTFIILGYIPTILVMFGTFVGGDLDAFRSAVRSYLVLIFPLSLLISTAPQYYGYSDFPHLNAPIYLLVLLIPWVGWKWKICILGWAIYISFWNISIRSGLVSCIISLLIMLFCSAASEKFFTRAVKFGRWVLLLIPLLFCLLGLMDKFDIFRDISGFRDNEATEDFLTDSRSNIYAEIKQSLWGKPEMLFGASASGYYYTSLLEIGDFDRVYGKGRRECEVGILNLLFWGGLFFVFLFFLIFCKVTGYAVNCGNNRFVQALGLWGAWNWAFCFVENPIGFNIYIFYMIIAVGACGNRKLCQMNDMEIKDYIRTLFFMKAKLNQ